MAFTSPRVALFMGLISVSLFATTERFPSPAYQTQLPKILKDATDVRGGQSLVEAHDKKTNAWVLVFMGTQCRLVRDYLPRLEGWAKEWKQKGVSLIGVFSHQHENAQEISDFAKKREISFPILHDADQKIATLLKARMTPETFVLGADFRLLYRGRIDDQYQLRASLPEPKNLDLERAVTSVLAGAYPTPAVTDVEGCFINLEVRPSDISFNEHIGPLVYQKCAYCHHEKEVGGELFKLTSFEAIAEHADTLLNVVENRTMPPWRAGPGALVQNDFSFGANDIWLFRQWVKGGLKRGPGELKSPVAPSKEGFRMGEPDAVVYMTEDDAPLEEKFFRVPSKSEEAVLPYKYFKVKTDFDEDKWLLAGEIKALVPEVVHHVTVFMILPNQEGDWVVERPRMRRIGSSIAKTRYNISEENFPWTYRLYGIGMRRQLQLITTFSPTEPTRRLPKGYGYLIPQGAELVFECHYTPTEEAKFDRTAVGLWFADSVPANPQHRQVITRSGAHMDQIKIPPHGKLTLDRKMKFFADAKLFTLRPHMHQRGKSFTGVLEYPDGRKETLLHVPDWDFNWQIPYDFTVPVIIPKGAILHNIYEWDNTDHARNPDPNVEVRFGQQFNDEMALSYPTYVYLNPEEQNEAEDLMMEYLMEDK